MANISPNRRLVIKKHPAFKSMEERNGACVIVFQKAKMTPHMFEALMDWGLKPAESGGNIIFEG